MLPILPLYFFYGLRQWIRLFERARLPVRLIGIGVLVGFVAVGYAGETKYESSLPNEPNVADVTAKELFAYVRTHTSPEDVLVFPKPRTLALFTDRRVAALAPDQSEEQSLAFLRSIHATVMIKSQWSAVSTLEEKTTLDKREVFQAGPYRVYRLNLVNGN